MVINTMSENEGSKMDTRGRDGPGPEVGNKETCLGRPHLLPVTCLPSSSTMRRFCE